MKGIFGPWLETKSHSRSTIHIIREDGSVFPRIDRTTCCESKAFIWIDDRNLLSFEDKTTWITRNRSESASYRSHTDRI